MSKLLGRLRSPATVFYEYAADDGALLKEAAAEIERLQARERELETVLMSVVGNVIEAIRELAPENPAVAALCDAYAKDLAAVSAEMEEP